MRLFSNLTIESKLQKSEVIQSGAAAAILQQS